MMIHNPNDADLYYQAGLLEEQQGRWDQALMDYQTAIRLTPELVEAYYRAGLVAERVGETYYLGKSRVVNGPQRQYAITVYRIAVQLNPEFADAYFRLGLTLLMAGELRQASETCQQLYRLDPHSERTLQLVQAIYDRYQAQPRQR